MVSRIFLNRYGNVAGAQEGTLDELAALIRSTTGRTKDELPLVKFETFGDLMTDDGCLRHDANVLSVTGVEADYDGEVMSFEEAVGIADKAGLYALLYTSPSHSPSRPRWRVLAPFSQAQPPQERDRMMGRLAGLYNGIFGSESWTLSQSYFVGRVDGKAIPQIEIVGEKPIDQIDELDDTWLGKPSTHTNGAAFANGPLDLEAELAALIAGERFHRPCIRILGKWAQSGMGMLEAQERLIAVFECVFPPDRDARWEHRRFVDLPRCLDYVYGKEADKRDEEVKFTIGGSHAPNEGAADEDSGTQDDTPDTPPFSEFVLQHTSFDFWQTRELPQVDKLMGDLMTTTSRILVVGPTGLGKTNFLVPLGFAIADGVGFLHWNGCGQPRRVLYIDGEMSRRLYRARLDDAARRHGNRPATFFPLSREDFEDMPPLDTIAGQQYLDSVIDVLGDVDTIILDNLQALTIGDLRDPLSWRKVSPWSRDLTRRCIGQLWVQHTGLDESHAYGDKTREWGLDTVGIMERVERPEADIAFRLIFPKARERTPDNRTDFEPTVITLAGDRWAWERGEHVRTKRTGTDRVLELLREAINRDGTIPPSSSHIPPHTRCVPEGLWRRYCELGTVSEGADDPTKKAEAMRKAFYRATQKLIGTSVGKWEEWVWLIP